MMFDYNPWTSLFLLQAFRMCKPPCVRSRTRRQLEIAQAEKHFCEYEPARLIQSPTPATPAPPAPRVKPAPVPRRGWRYAFRTGRAGAEPVHAAPQRGDVAA